MCERACLRGRKLTFEAVTYRSAKTSLIHSAEWINADFFISLLRLAIALSTSASSKSRGSVGRATSSAQSHELAIVNQTQSTLCTMTAMARRETTQATRAIAVSGSRVVSDSKASSGWVRSATKFWQPVESLSTEEVRAVLAAVHSAVRPISSPRCMGRGRSHLWTPGAPTKGRAVQQRGHAQSQEPQPPGERVFRPGPNRDLPGELLLRAHEQNFADDEPLFFSRNVGADGSRRHSRARAGKWLIVREASERAAVRVLTLRPQPRGHAGEAASVHPHHPQPAACPTTSRSGVGFRWRGSPQPTRVPPADATSHRLRVQFADAPP